MNKIISFYNQNRRNIILGIMGLVFIIVLIQTLNYMARQNKNKYVEKKEEVGQLPVKSIITGETINTEKTKVNISIIEDFINKCDQKDIDGAYALISEDCKEILFPTKEIFIKSYYNLIFSKKKTYGINNFLNSSKTYTYEVTFYNDALADGKVDVTQSYRDYITVDTKLDEKKLNINSFIYRQNINKKQEQDKIEFIVLSKEVYKEYEIYNIQVQNNTDKAILLDSKNKSKTIYGIGTDNSSYVSLKDTLSVNTLRLEPTEKRTYNVKINKIYNPSISIKAISFTDIILDYEKYISEPSSVTDRVKIKIKL